MYNNSQEAVRQPIYFTEVTLRDGEQQEKTFENMPITDRLAVFDLLVDTGMQRIEIGHLANPYDIVFARALVNHIHHKESAGDTRYETVELQVLFGSQADIMEPGIQALQTFDKNRVIVHVYDRVSSALRNLAQTPKTVTETTESVIAASTKMIDAGFTRFSISGEGAVNHDDPIEETLGYYTTIMQALEQQGAQEINVNVANTFGLSLGGSWNERGLYNFNEQVRSAVSDTRATTSIHAHNDMNTATEFSLAAIRAGFDRVEGTLIGMGERTGNVPLVDVMARLIEDARHNTHHTVQALGHVAQAHIWQDRYIPEDTVASLDTWHTSASRIAEIYGTQDRFHRTSLGNPDAYAAGSGPHAHANKAALENPLQHPVWKNYCHTALIHAIMGRPEAKQVLAVDPERMKAVTLETHAAGGSTRSVHNETVAIAPRHVRTEAARIAYDSINRILAVMRYSSNTRQYSTSCYTTIND